MSLFLFWLTGETKQDQSGLWLNIKHLQYDNNITLILASLSKFKDTVGMLKDIYQPVWNLNYFLIVHLMQSLIDELVTDANSSCSIKNFLQGAMNNRKKSVFPNRNSPYTRPYAASDWLWCWHFNTESKPMVLHQVMNSSQSEAAGRVLAGRGW